MSKKSAIKTYTLDATVVLEFTHVGVLSQKTRLSLGEEIQVAIDNAVTATLQRNDCLEQDLHACFDVEIDPAG